MAQFKTLAQLSKAYKDGKLSKKDKLCLSGKSAKVMAVPVDKKTKKPVVGATPEVVFEATSDQLLLDALKLAGVPVSS